ncbi:hypothetical protein FACS1894170_09620 [Planctomycetales bacterium]|nr:hypothetical protein FACS1894170_09620 [Planctomycetales bacterium]
MKAMALSCIALLAGALFLLQETARLSERLSLLPKREQCGRDVLYLEAVLLSVMGRILTTLRRVVVVAVDVLRHQS